MFVWHKEWWTAKPEEHIKNSLRFCLVGLGAAILAPMSGPLLPVCVALDAFAHAGAALEIGMTIGSSISSVITALKEHRKRKKAEKAAKRTAKRQRMLSNEKEQAYTHTQEATNTPVQANMQGSEPNAQAIKNNRIDVLISALAQMNQKGANAGTASQRVSQIFNEGSKRGNRSSHPSFNRTHGRT